MITIFKMYLQLGFQHISDFAGYDHILFITVLCAVYSVNEWRKILMLITAFTLGHSTTLALATLQFVTVPSRIIEFLIPVTIFITAFANIFQKNETVSVKFHWVKYSCTFFFGLIHGLGFSTYLKALLGLEDSIIMPLFSFNIGIELGQFFIITIIFLISFLVLRYLHLQKRIWNLLLSGMGVLISLFLMIQRFPWK